MSKDIIREPLLRFPGFDDEWKKEKLGDIAETYSGLGGKTKKDFSSSKSNSFFISYLDILNNNFLKEDSIVSKVFLKENEKQTNVKQYDVLMTLSSENYTDLGATCVYLGNDPVYLNSFSIGIRPLNSDGVFLNYLMKSPDLRKKIELEGQGITRINLSQGRIKNINLSLPSREEQSKIGSFFKTLDSLIENQESYIDKLEKEKKGLLQDIFSRGLRLLDEYGERFEGEWKEVKLGEVSDIKTGKLNANEADEDGKYPFFTCSKDILKINKYAYNIDAILLAGNGDIGDLKRYNGKFNAYQRTYIISTKESLQDKYSLDYIYYYMEYNFKSYIYNLINSSAMTYIRMGDLSSYKTSIPSLEEQKAIGLFFKKIDEKIEKEKELLKKYKEMKQGLLQDMFI